jgi:hypothetical protein
MDACGGVCQPGSTDPSNPPCCEQPTKCNPCGAPCLPICGSCNPSLTCRPAGRPWGRACGPVTFKCGRWDETKNKKNCRPMSVKGRNKNGLPYGFGVYARKLYPFGLPCVGNYCLPEIACNKTLYPMLPTKPGKVYSTYTFNTRGPPYTCPRPCIS